MLFYSSRTSGFYDDAVHEKLAIPDDAVEITPDLHRALLDGQALGPLAPPREQARSGGRSCS